MGGRGIELERYGTVPPGSRENLGRIVRVDRGECDVATVDGRLRVASDSVRAQGATAPVTGDWVRIGESDGLPVIAEILPRGPTLSRRDPSEQVVEQVLVANVDVVLIVQGLDRPLPTGRLERFLVLAWDSGADAAVVLTKADRVDEARVAETVAVVEAVDPNVEVIVTSTQTGVGLDRIEQRLDAGLTVALLGESGAGKSSLVNALLGAEELETGEVRGHDNKGRHTTVARELVPRPEGGVLIDTPGIRAVGIWDAEEALDRVFGDLIELAAGCRFVDCRHAEEPGCAVLSAVEDGELSARRVGRFRALVEELEVQRARVVERERRGPGRRRRGRRKRR